MLLEEIGYLGLVCFFHEIIKTDMIVRAVYSYTFGVVFISYMFSSRAWLVSGIDLRQNRMLANDLWCQKIQGMYRNYVLYYSGYGHQPVNRMWLITRESKEIRLLNLMRLT